MRGPGRESEIPGTNTSAVEVTNISRHGFWVLLDERERCLPLEELPWFRDAAVGTILNDERPQSHHLYWPDLDLDLGVDSIEHPEKYPRKWGGRVTLIERGHATWSRPRAAAA